MLPNQAPINNYLLSSNASISSLLITSFSCNKVASFSNAALFVVIISWARFSPSLISAIISVSIMRAVSSL